MDSGWLSNAYVLGDEPGGVAVFVDSGAPLEPLLRFLDEHRLDPQCVLRTHAHIDHIANEDDLGLPVVTGPFSAGGLDVEAIPTPAHSDDMVCFVANGELVFSGDTLFKDAVGGGPFEAIRHQVMDVFMAMPHSRRVLPGHTDETTIGREWESNPFVRVWRGLDAEGTERVRVDGRDATLVVWSPDYDGKGKAWSGTRTAPTRSSAARASVAAEFSAVLDLGTAQDPGSGLAMPHACSNARPDPRYFSSFVRCASACCSLHGAAISVDHACSTAATTACLPA